MKECWCYGPSGGVVVLMVLWVYFSVLSFVGGVCEFFGVAAGWLGLWWC